MDASIIVAIISVIGSFVVIYLSSVKDYFTLKNKVRREQLDKFYIPFYQNYCAGFLSINKLSEMSLEARSKFLDLFTKNIYLMEPKSQSMYNDFYQAFLNMLSAYNEEPDYPFEKCSHEFDTIFNNMSNAILSEYKDILRKCRLPVPLIKTK